MLICVVASEMEDTKQVGKWRVKSTGAMWRALELESADSGSAWLGMMSFRDGLWEASVCRCWHIVGAQLMVATLIVWDGRDRSGLQAIVLPCSA